MDQLLNDALLQTAVALLQAGKLVAFPTETVYGLGAPICAPASIAKIFELKGRPADNPLIAHISSFNQIDLVSSSLSRDFWILAEHFFPGPLTLIVPKAESVPLIATAGLSTIGVRMPLHPIAHQLIEHLGIPLVAPSANLSGYPSATTAAHVRHDFKDEVFVLEGACGIGLESTVLQLEPFPLILRPGSITGEQIEAVLGRPVQREPIDTDRPASPGMKYRHYAPKAKVTLAFEMPAEQEGARLIYPTPETLYAELRSADLEGVKHIIVRCDERVQKDQALMNRLVKAADLN